MKFKQCNKKGHIWDDPAGIEFKDNYCTRCGVTLDAFNHIKSLEKLVEKAWNDGYCSRDDEQMNGKRRDFTDFWEEQRKKK